MLFSNEFLFLAPEKPAFLQAEGGFSRQVFVLIEAESAHSAANREFLAKVLLAANLNLAQDALLAEIPFGEPNAIAPDLKKWQPRQVLVFGIPPEQLGLSFSPQAYQPFSFYNATWLFADRLSILEPDKTRKSQLWSALKQMFL